MLLLVRNRFLHLTSDLRAYDISKCGSTIGILTYSRNQNRDKIQIIANILRVSEADMKKTHIMYSANLGSEQITHYMSQLQSNGMLEQKSKAITESSINALFYSILANLVDSYEQLLT